MRPTVRVVALCLLCVAAGKLHWIFEGTTWTCTDTRVREKTRIKGVPALTDVATPALELELGADTWMLARGGAPWTSGTWSRKSPSKRAMKLEPGTDAIAALELQYAAIVALEAESAGVADPLVDATLVKSKLKFGLKRDKKAGTVSGRLKGKLSFRGTVSGTRDGQPWERPWKTKVSVAATSEPVPESEVAQPADVDTTPPVADFNVGSTSGVAPFTVQFASTDSGYVTERLWDFDDGTVSTDEHPTHTFTDPGLYQVSLSVSGPYGDDVATRPINVRGAPTTLETLYPMVVEGADPDEPQLLVADRPADAGIVALNRPLPGGGLVGSRMVFARPVGDLVGVSTYYEVHLPIAAELGSGELTELLFETCVILRRTGPEPDTEEFLVEPAVYTVSVPPSDPDDPPPAPNVNLTTLGPKIDAAPDDIIELHVLNISPVQLAPTNEDLVVVDLRNAWIVVPARPGG